MYFRFSGFRKVKAGNQNCSSLSLGYALILANFRLNVIKKVLIKKKVNVWSPLGFSLSLTHTHIGLPQGFNFNF